MRSWCWLMLARVSGSSEMCIPHSGPHPAQCPLSAPLSWSPPGSGSDAVQRLFTSSDPRLRRQWLAVTPIMLLTQPPAQNHIRLMTRGGWQSDVSPLLSQLPGRCIPRPKLIKMIRFVSVTANSSVCLHPTIRDTCSQEKVKRCWIQFGGSYTFNDSSRYVYQNSSAGFWTIHERMKLRNDRHIFCKPASERCSIFTVYYTAVYFTSCVKIYDWIILNVYRQPKYIAICQILGNIDIP